MKDPVCGMEVLASSKFRSAYKNKEYFFCSSSCKEKFDKEPKNYAK